MRLTSTRTCSASVDDSSFAKIFTHIAHIAVVPQVLYVLNSLVLLYAYTLVKHPHRQLIPPRRLHIVS
jgi:hypothetical protein